jgi:D-inositol-3-phosphate glycosyltransferase
MPSAPRRRFSPRRVATLSLHTSPLERPGTGDAGGMNVYVAEVSRQLAAAGVEVDIFTRATSSDLPPVVELAPGVTVRHVSAGPYGALDKSQLPAQLCALTWGVLRAEAESAEGHYDIIHSHYWLSGHVGWLAKERWGVPLVHTMHTMAKVKNLSLSPGEAPEPLGRVVGEEQVVTAADRLIASTATEVDELVGLYGADARRIATVAPGVDVETFRPGRRDRSALGLDEDTFVVVFAGRLQPLKAPDVLLEAFADLTRRIARPARLVIIGGPSGNGSSMPQQLRDMAVRNGIADQVTFLPPQGRDELARWYRAADVVAVPSRSESFGLVAAEAQACGTPVVAAAVGGLTHVVDDGRTGLLVRSHDPSAFADALADLATCDVQRRAMALAAAEHGARFSWAATAAGTLAVYRSALADAADSPVRLVAGA